MTLRGATNSEKKIYKHDFFDHEIMLGSKRNSVLLGFLYRLGVVDRPLAKQNISYFHFAG